MRACACTFGHSHMVFACMQVCVGTRVNALCVCVCVSVCVSDCVCGVASAVILPISTLLSMLLLVPITKALPPTCVLRTTQLARMGYVVPLPERYTCALF